MQDIGQDIRDLDGEFRAGRRDALVKIAAALRDGSSKYAAIAVDDFFAFSMNAKEKKIITEVVSSPFMDHYRQYVLDAVKALESGHDLLTIMGQDHIKKYKAVTSGDYDAGAFSAAHDMKFLMLGIDLNKVIDDFTKTLRGRKELAQIFVKGAENNSHSALNSEEREKPKYEDVLRRFLLMMIATKLDGDLSKVQGRFITEAKLPHLVGYDHEEAKPLRFRFLRHALRRLSEPMNVITRLKGKVPTSWPPFKVSFNSVSAGQANETRITHAEFMAAEQNKPVNESADFQAGFAQALEHIYLGSQKRHFEIMNDNQGGYAAQFAISDFWEKVVKQVSSQAYGDLRAEVRERINHPAKGEGHSFDDGVKAAQNWAQDYLQVLAVHGSSGGQPEHERALSKFKNFWKAELLQIMDRFSPSRQSFISVTDAPKASVA